METMFGNPVALLQKSRALVGLSHADVAIAVIYIYQTANNSMGEFDVETKKKGTQLKVIHGISQLTSTATKQAGFVQLIQ
jgi:hypothetical protein